MKGDHRRTRELSAGASKGRRASEQRHYDRDKNRKAFSNYKTWEITFKRTNLSKY